MLKAISYFLVLPIIYGVSLLPFWVLHGISDTLYVVIYRMFGYRRGVVRQNLRNAFPDKSDSERAIIEHKFYRFLFDVMVESIKALTMSRSTLMKRCTIAEPNLFKEYHAQGKSILVVMGHFGNWEYAGLRSCLETDHQYKYIYRILSNKWFDGMFKNLRGRFGAEPVAMEQIYRNLISTREQLSVTAFITDQAPPPEGAYWTNFLHQDTPVFKGTEKIATKLGYPVVFGSVWQLRRGYYEIRLETLSADPGSMREGELTELHTKTLERHIEELPHTWLWSHKRWKHTRSNGDS